MRKMLVASAAMAAAGCAVKPDIPPPPPPLTIHHAQPPAGMAIIGASTFGTIDIVPPSPTGDIKPSRPTYNGPVEWYAQENGLTKEEAGKRLAEQQQLMPVFERLQARLQREEPGNYVGARLVHQPDWAYELSFKQDPEATLRKYSVNPRFRAAKGGATAAELQAIAAPWIQRFSNSNILGVYGVSAMEGRIPITITISEDEFRALSETKGWGPPPPELDLRFARALDIPRVDPRVQPFVRGFASESAATVIQPEAGFEGRVVLDDGCLRLSTKDGRKGPLVAFHKETGIGLDEQGYLAIIDRATGKAKGRVGEMWSWAGPNGGTAFDGVEQLKAACGAGPIVNVGNPESRARFEARHPGN